jgi:glycosyltransferase involved in cell wall biosynthesis
MLTEEEMSGLYMSGDCYVSLDRGEGFGLGPFQAGANGKPIIVTGFGGVTEYAKHDNSYLVDYVEVPVFGMPYSPWYLLEQNWAEASQAHGSSLMKHVFNNRDEAYTKGRNLQKFIFDNFNENVIGNRIINAIRSV